MRTQNKKWARVSEAGGFVTFLQSNSCGGFSGLFLKHYPCQTHQIVEESSVRARILFLPSCLRAARLRGASAPVSKLWNPHVPFSPARWPFFYGWIIVFGATVGTLFTIPGQ